MSLHNIRGSNVIKFTADEVAEWVTEALELPRHAEIFHRWGIDGPTLLNLTSADLENQFAALAAMDREKTEGNMGGEDSSLNLFKDFIAIKKIVGHINIFKIQLSQDVVLYNNKL